VHSNGQAKVTSRSRPQHCEQILSVIAGQARLALRCLQMGQAMPPL
jgi:hypothetical protein